MSLTLNEALALLNDPANRTPAGLMAIVRQTSLATPADAPGATTLLYSGPLADNGGLSSARVADYIAQTYPEGVRVLDNADAGRLLQNSAFQSAALEALGTEAARNAWLYNATEGPWAEVSRSFVEAADGRVVSLTPFASPDRTFAQVEVEAALRSNAPSIEGLPREHLLAFRDSLVERGVSQADAASSVRQILSMSSRVNIEKVPLVVENGAVTWADVTRLIGGNATSAPPGSTPTTVGEIAGPVNEPFLETVKSLNTTVENAGLNAKYFGYVEKSGAILGTVGGIMMGVSFVAMGLEVKEKIENNDGVGALETVRDWSLGTAGAGLFGSWAFSGSAALLAPLALLGPVGIGVAVAGVIASSLLGAFFGHWLGKKTGELITGTVEDLTHEAAHTTSPLILDLDGDGVETTHLSIGTQFDHDGNGFAEQTGWVGKDDGLLVFDRNANGRVDNGRELFGNNTVMADGAYAENGFEALESLDSNNDGIINSADAAFVHLRVWKDIDSDGFTDSNELLTLSAAGVQSISTAYTNGVIVDAHGNEHRQRGAYVTTGGLTRTVDDVWFVADGARTTNVGEVPVSPAIEALPNIAGFGNVRSLHQAMALDTTGHIEDLVADFAAEPDAPDRLAIARQLLFAWVGVENVDPNSRGQYISDARIIYVVETFMGRGFIQGSGTNAGTPDPGPVASGVLTRAFDTLVGYVNAELMRQTHLDSLFESIDLVYDPVAGTLMWDLDETLDMIETAYNANPTQGRDLAHAFFTSLEYGGAVTAGALSALRAQGDIQGTGLAFELAVLGSTNVVSGTSANESLNGTNQRDYVIGYAGNDSINGGAGDDFLEGGAGNDTLIGGVGSDNYRFALGDGQDTISNQDTSTARHDVLEFKAGISSSDITFTASGDHLVIGIEGTTDQITISNYFVNATEGGYAIDEIRFADGTSWNRAKINELALEQAQGTEASDSLAAFSTGSVIHGYGGNDSITGHAGADLLYGDEGNDTVSGLAGNDVLEGGAGNDTLNGGAGADTLTGGTGNDTLFGDGDADVLVGNDGNDTLDGGLGDDDLNGGNGEDTLQGGGGNDTYHFAATGARDTIIDTAGTDALVLGTGIAPNDVSLFRVGDSLHVVIDSSPTQLTVSNHFLAGQSVEEIRFEDGTLWNLATINANATHGTQNNQVGNILWDNVYVVDHVQDSVFEEQTGSYTVLPYSQDVVQSWVPFGLPFRVDDLVLTGVLNIAGTGNSLDNLIRGNSGNNVIEGDGGRDTIIGGAGLDTLVFRSGDGLDVIDCDAPDGVADTLRIHGFASGALTFGRVGNDLIINLSATDKVSLRDYYNGKSANLGRIEFADSDTSWTGDDLWSQVSALSSGVTAGADSIAGSVLNDVIDGGTGADTMSGGDGHDTYYVDNVGDVIVETLGQYTRPDTNAAVYYQDLAISSVAYTLSDHVENLRLVGTNNLNGTGNALNNRLEGNSGANTLTGLGGKDVLDGGAGADTLIGGDGDDTYIVDNAGDTIVETSTGGWDSVSSSVTYSLASEVENLTLTGMAAINGTGNALANQLTGNTAVNHLIGGDGADQLDGGGGGDTLEGGAGDDYYIVRSASDVVIESGGTNDRIDTFVSYALGEASGIETLAAAANGITLTGNSGSNGLFTQMLGNILDGGAGDDRLDSFSTSATFIFGRGYGKDTLTRASGTLRFQPDVLPTDVTVRVIGADLVIGINGTSDVVTVVGNYGLFGHQSNIDRVEFANGTAWDYATAEAIGRAYVNQAPTVATRLADQTVTVNTAYSLTIPTNLFQDADTLESSVKEYFVTQLDGSAPPAWLSFNYATGVLSGTPGSSALGTINIAVTTIDAGNAQATDVFSLVVYDPALARTGTSANNTLTGTSGANLMDGLAGNDSMSGGAGNDIYIFDSAGDTATENSNAGTDEIRSTVSITTLANNVERVTLLGAANLNATGNTLANLIIGNLGNNTLSGGDGNDTIYGGGAGTDTLNGGIGNDIFIVDAAGVTVVEAAGQGTDEVRSYVSYTLTANVENLTLVRSLNVNVTSGDVNGTGNALNNSIVGHEGNNILDGGAGADTMNGGMGDDIYYVDNAGDTISDSQGTDEIRSSISWTLAPIGSNEIERLTLIGIANINATGNAGPNILTGNTGNNTLTGGLGEDTLYGGGGVDILQGGDYSDTYIVDSTTVTIVELDFEGDDTVRSSIDFTLPNYVEHLILTGSGNINGTGNSVFNAITGNSGNNILDGGLGGDNLQGGAGDDIYIVDDFGDWLTENADQGIDEVRAALTWTLANHFENLTLTGSAPINGTGNDLANVIVGNSGANTLNGGLGADTLQGGGGNDVYVLDNVGDVVVESAGGGTDTIQASFGGTLAADIENYTLTGAAVANITGNAGANTLIGNSAANTIDGGAGSDSMQGGAGDDIYIFDNSSDSALENFGGGLDEIRSSVTITSLASNVERLVLTGTSAINGTGNTLANYIEGNSAANTIDGGTGNDTMVGGAGDDVYLVDAAADLIFENANEGFDEVRANASYTIWGNIEHLNLQGTSSLNGTGNSGSNLLRGNSGNNVLVGGGGSDVIEGGNGSDTLSNPSGNALFNGGAQNDTITGGTLADIFIGGAGNDSLTTGGGADIIAFNKGDGQDTVGVSTTQDDTLSIGNAVYADLVFQKSGNNLVLNIGASDRITFTNYYATAANRSVSMLQMVIEGTAEYDTGSGNSMRDNKIEMFDFEDLVAAFDTARALNPSLTSWALANALASHHLSGSDTAAIGGDFAYRYNRYGTLGDISFAPAAAILGSGSFGSAVQTLQSVGQLQDSTVRLS